LNGKEERKRTPGGQVKNRSHTYARCERKRKRREDNEKRSRDHKSERRNGKR